MFGFKRNTKKEKFFLNWKEEKVKLTIYHENRKDSRVSLSKSGVNIRLPILLPEFEKKRMVEKFVNWAKEKLDEKPYFHFDKYKKYIDGEVLNLFDRNITIAIKPSTSSRNFAKITDNILHINHTSFDDEAQKNQTISKLVYKVLAKAYKPLIWEKLNQFNEEHQFGKLLSMRMKNNSSNWGSCSNRGNINISVRLLLAPENVLNYVLIHELAHLQQQNHSSQFWKIVGKACPDYQKHEVWLKTNAKYCVV